MSRHQPPPAKQPPAKQPPAKPKPVHEVRLGLVRAAIWENETESGTRYNVTFSRLYKDDQDHWADSTSFGREDLLLLGKVADQAHSWIHETQSSGERQ